MVVHIFIGLHYCCDLRDLHGWIYFYSSKGISYLKVLMHELNSILLLETLLYA
jgi:hypothetical protein